MERRTSPLLKTLTSTPSAARHCRSLAATVDLPEAGSPTMAMTSLGAPMDHPFSWGLAFITLAPGGTSEVTHTLAPITAPLPTVMRPSTVAPE